MSHPRDRELIMMKNRGLVKKHSPTNPARHLHGCTACIAGWKECPAGSYKHTDLPTLKTRRGSRQSLTSWQLQLGAGTAQVGEGWEICQTGSETCTPSEAGSIPKMNCRASHALGKCSYPPLSQVVIFAHSPSSIQQHLGSKNQLPALDTWLETELIP